MYAIGERCYGINYCQDQENLISVRIELSKIIAIVLTRKNLFLSFSPRETGWELEQLNVIRARHYVA